MVAAQAAAPATEAEKRDAAIAQDTKLDTSKPHPPPRVCTFQLTDIQSTFLQLFVALCSSSHASW